MMQENEIQFKEKINHSTENENRSRLLKHLPVVERRLQLAGISTSVLEGGEGRPVVLLHGPGENSFWWMRVIPSLATTHRVIVPDLPGHGASKIQGGAFDPDSIIIWLGKLVEQTCQEPPILVGHVLGGSIAARFAINRGDKISRLILVDALGLGKFRPSLRFAFGLIRFTFHPTEKNFDRFIPQCMYDVGSLRRQMGSKWDLFQNYNLECANNPAHKAVLQVFMRKLGVPKIPPEELGRINVPVSLIWGRHDRANKLKIARDASQRYHWPLYIIEDTRDDPKLEQPEAFERALRQIISESRK